MSSLLECDRMCVETAIRLAARGEYRQVSHNIAANLRTILPSSWASFADEGLNVSNMQLARAWRVMSTVVDPGYMPGLSEFQAILATLAPTLSLITDRAA